MLNKISCGSKKLNGCGVIAIAFIGTLCTLGAGYIPFGLHTHGNAEWAIALIIDLYSQSSVGIPTLIWYGVMAILLGSVWKLTKRVEDDFYRVLWRSGWIAFLLTPNIYINPPPSFGAAFTDPKNWGAKPEILVLPAILCFVQYAFYLVYHFEDFYPIAAVVSLSFSPISAVWFITSIVAVVCRGKSIAKT